MSIVAMRCSLFPGSSFGLLIGAPHLEDWLLSGASAANVSTAHDVRLFHTPSLDGYQAAHGDGHIDYLAFLRGVL
jgi:hypothetical protein